MDVHCTLYRRYAGFSPARVGDATSVKTLVRWSPGLPSLVSRPHFSRPSEKWVWSTAYSIFVQVRWNVGALFFSNLTLDVVKDCIPHCVNDLLVKWTLIGQPYLPRIDQAFLSFERSTSRLTQSLLFTRAFLNTQSS